MRRFWKPVLAAALCLLLLSAAVYLLTMYPYRGSLLNPFSTQYPPNMEQSQNKSTMLTADQVREDLEKAHRLVRTRHPAWLLNQALAKQVDEAFATAIGTASQQTVGELQSTISGCLAPLADSHTAVYHRSGQEETEESDETEASFVSYRLDTERDLGVFTLRRCVVNEVYGNALTSFFQGVRTNGVSNIVLDLRGNGGGNSQAAYLFLEYLDVDAFRVRTSDVRHGWYLQRGQERELLNNKRTDAFSGTMYLITDRNTYSSALIFAELLADNDIAVHVGEAPAALPDHYGDLLCFRLPNSGLQLDVSYKRFYRTDQTQAGLPLEPDHPSEDPMETVYSFIKQAKLQGSS